MTDRELMQQALDALENGDVPTPENVGKNLDAITALRERLAQPEQKQDSTCNKTLRAEGKGYPRTCMKCGKGPCIADRVQPEQEPTGKQHLQVEQPVQEPVSLETIYETIIQWDEGGGKRSRRELARRIVDLYTATPQRKPLTDEEIREIADKHLFYQPEGYEVSGVFALARAIEAAHGIGEKPDAA